jgi:hypothetical protein
MNTWVMASYHYTQSEAVEEFQKNIDYFFLAAFTIELILKLVGFGFRNYVKSGFNNLDAAIIVISLIEMLLSTLTSLEIIEILRLFKAIRAIRMLKLARYNQGMQKVLD